MACILKFTVETASPDFTKVMLKRRATSEADGCLACLSVLEEVCLPSNFYSERLHS